MSKASPQTVRHALDRASVGIVITDPTQDDNPIVYVNQGFVSLTEYSREYAMGRNCRFLQGENTDERDIERIHEGLAARREFDVRILNYKADGTPFRNQVLISPVEDENGSLTAFFAVQRAVADEPDGEEEETGGGSRPEHSTPSVVMLRELQHRVKNHLAMVVSLIRLHATRELTQESFNALAHRVEALALLYDAMLAPGDEDDTETVAAGAYLSRVATVIGSISGRPDVRMKIDCQSVRLSVNAAGRLGLLLTELLTNTFEHAFEGRGEGLVTVRFQRLDSGTARLIVEDNGIGLPEGSDWPYASASIPEQQGRAEEEGGSLDTTSAGGNSGLGGSIVLGLTKVLGATLDVRSGPEGTRIAIDLDEDGVPS